MRRGRPRSYEVQLSDNEREMLESFARSRSLPSGLTRRAKIVVMASEGVPSSAIAEKLEVSNPTVAKWCRRYIDGGLAGLYDLPVPGRPRTFDDDEVARLMQKALNERPDDATHWSTRSFARQTELSKSTVHRYFSLFGIQPHRTRTFKLSTDPFFIEKVRDIVGLYLNPPDNALVLCVDEERIGGEFKRTGPLRNGVVAILTVVWPGSMTCRFRGAPEPSMTMKWRA